jgi:hypothetical protein
VQINGATDGCRGETVIFSFVDTKTYLICKLGHFIFKLGDEHYSIKVAPEIDTCHTEIG